MSRVAPWNVLLGGVNIGLGAGHVSFSVTWAIFFVLAGTLIAAVGLFGRDGVYDRP